MIKTFSPGRAMDFQIFCRRGRGGEDFLAGHLRAHPGELFDVAFRGEACVVGGQDEADRMRAEERQKFRHPREGGISLPEDAVHVEN